MLSVLKVTKGEDSVALKKIFPLSPERMYEYFTKPELLARWFGNTSVVDVQAKLDLQVGGHFEIEAIEKNGGTYTASGCYREIRTNEFLRMSWTWKHLPDETSELCVIFTAVTAGCEVELQHRGLTSETRVEQHSEGWCASYEKLERAAKP